MVVVIVIEPVIAITDETVVPFVNSDLVDLAISADYLVV